jgi:hypothetical protein
MTAIDTSARRRTVFHRAAGVGATSVCTSGQSTLMFHLLGGRPQVAWLGNDPPSRQRSAQCLSYRLLRIGRCFVGTVPDLDSAHHAVRHIPKLRRKHSASGDERLRRFSVSAYPRESEVRIVGEPTALAG